MISLLFYVVLKFEFRVINRTRKNEGTRDQGMMLKICEHRGALRKMNIASLT